MNNRNDPGISQQPKAISAYGVTIDSLDGNFWLETEVAKADRRSLLSLENPKYAEAIQKYPHLTGIQVKDRDDKIGRPVKPVAELTKLMEKKVCF